MTTGGDTSYTAPFVRPSHNYATIDSVVGHNLPGRNIRLAVRDLSSMCDKTLTPHNGILYEFPVLISVKRCFKLRPMN